MLEHSSALSQYLESWINAYASPTLRAVRRAYQELLQRKLGSDEFRVHLCASGTEGIERSLAYFFDRRPNPAARQVLAFEGAFHGRMMVALASTWNPSKREPFAWPGKGSVFAPYPEMDHDDVHQPHAPEGWCELWSQTSDEEFAGLLDKVPVAGDPLLQEEVKSLQVVRQQLRSGNIFVILIEAMQCEGGDRYSSARFHQGLACLSSAFQIPLIYDEIQTGFGLGGELFWHRMFCLTIKDGQPFYPNAVVCAKKAQTGLVLLRESDSPPPDAEVYDFATAENYSTASLIRGYIQASVIDQFHDAILEMERRNREQLQRLVKRFAGHVFRPRAKGLAFAFDLESPEVMARFVAQRFQYGLLYYPAGSKTARFRLNLGFRGSDFQLFWKQVTLALEATIAACESAAGEQLANRAPDAANQTVVELKDTSHYFDFHELLIDRKLQRLQERRAADEGSAIGFLECQLRESFPAEDFEVVILDATNYADYRTRILAMQVEVYEPARRSPAESFDALFASATPLSILVLQQEQIVAMACAGPLSEFASTRGVNQDPFRDDPSVVYMLDLTVAESFRGQVGRFMKRAMILLAEESGVTAIHGRNRDRLAASMWAINLSFGSYSIQHLTDDYPDDKRYRDCIYYRCPTVWQSPAIDLSSAIEMPLGVTQLDAEFMQTSLPVLVNKMTLSNFVTESFLRQLEEVAQAFPPELRHVYAGSGLSECMDKIVKVLWIHRQPRTKLVTFVGHDFGNGSLLSRSLSGLGHDFFDVERLTLPASMDDEAAWACLNEVLETGNILAVFLEPLLRRTMTRVATDVLAGIIARCRHHEVPVVFHETAGMVYRYSRESFTPSGLPGLRPDASVVYLGGQMAMVFVSQPLFLSDPLLLISTWEGDAFSLAQFHRALQIVQDDPQAYFQAVSRYQQRMTDILDELPSAEMTLSDGLGVLAGEIPDRLASLFRRVGSRRWLSCPSYAEMCRFLDWY